MKNKDKQKGITLIALIVTIIILLILAGITIVSMNENGLLEKAITAKEKQKIAEYQEAIKLAQTQSVLENYETKETKVILERIRDILKDEKIFKGSTFIIENEILKITTSEKYVFEVTQNYVLYKGKTGEMSPTISLVSISSTSNSITIEIETDTTDINSIKYYIKSESDKEYNLEETTKNLNYNYKDLTQNMTYNIKVVVETQNGSSELGPINQKTGTVDIATGNIRFSSESWSNGKASISLSTSTKYNIQYQINEINDNGWKTSKSVGGLNDGDIVYARLWDGKNGGEMASKTISDTISPSALIYYSNDKAYIPNSIVLHVSLSDNQSGVNIQKCRWILNKSNKLLGTEDDSSYTEIFNSETEDLTLNTTEPGTYYLHVLTVDKANNKIEEISSKIEFLESSSPGLTAANYGDKINYSVEVNGVVYDDWKVFYKDKDSDSVYMIYGSVIPNNIIDGAAQPSCITKSYDSYGIYWNEQIYNNPTSDDYNHLWASSFIDHCLGMLNGETTNELGESFRMLSYNLPSYGDVTATPNLDLLIKSWNEKGYRTLYKHKNDYGSICWVDFKENSTYDSGNSYEGEKDSLYFAEVEESGPEGSMVSHYNYWLTGELPNNDGENSKLLFKFDGKDTNLISAGAVDMMEQIGLRPVIEITHYNKLTQQEDNSWNIE